MGKSKWVYLIKMFSNSTCFYIDGIMAKEIILNCTLPIRYIGNSAGGDEPFGIFADLRIFAYCINSKQIKLQASYSPEESKF
jgi:hypothetical protein